MILLFGWRKVIDVRAQRAATVVQKSLDGAHLLGAKPDAVMTYLDQHGFDHLEYTGHNRTPELNRTVDAWTTRRLGGMPHPTQVWVEGCVLIRFHFNRADRLEGYDISPEIRGAVDS